MKHQFKKKFGQNFLKDENLLKKIVKDAKIENQNVIEIGPGMGALTKHIIQYASSFVAYEVDISLKNTLDEIIKDYPHFNIVFEDFLESDLKNVKKDTTVIGNIPYNITSPIIFKVIAIDNISKIVIMIQKEVADRIIAQPKTKAYNALSVMLQTQFNISKVVDVNKKMFYPVPKVDSIVIKMEKKEPYNEPFNTFVKACFKQKRKTLANNVLEAGYFTKESLYHHLKKLNYNESSRAEEIKVEDFKILFEISKVK